MHQALIPLVAANALFVGSHLAMSHSLRTPMQEVLGEKGFQAVYSIVSLLTFAWVIFAFRAAPNADLPGSGAVGWLIATLVMIPALVLFAGSIAGNPALPVPGASNAARAEPKGVFTITRHPMMWGFALWALSHLVLFYSWRTMITAAAMGALALYGAHLQDGKKRVQMGDAWEQWEARTNFWPRWDRLFSAGMLPWAIGLILWVFLSWLHMPIGGIPAGIWRWF